MLKVKITIWLSSVIGEQHEEIVEFEDGPCIENIIQVADDLQTDWEGIYSEIEIEIFENGEKKWKKILN